MITYADVHDGDELPSLEIPITSTQIVAGAIASEDYQDVHHDPALARQRGSKDIFMNILTTNGLVGRYVTDWAGPTGWLYDVDIRLGAPNHPGDVMTFTGTVAHRRGPDDSGTRGLVELAVRGANSLGDHVTGTVVVSLPLGP